MAAPRIQVIPPPDVPRQHPDPLIPPAAAAESGRTVAIDRADEGLAATIQAAVHHTDGYSSSDGVAVETAATMRPTLETTGRVEEQEEEPSLCASLSRFPNTWS